MNEQIKKLVKWLESCKCFDIQGCTATIGQETYPAARYKQTFQPLEGARSQEEYTRDAIYVIGKLPKDYMKSSKVCYVIQHEPHEWYIGAHYPDFKRGKQAGPDPKYSEHHPFDYTFILFPSIPTEHYPAIDTYEPVKYRRVGLKLDLKS